MDRRKFLAGAAALFAGPAIIKSTNLMSTWVPPKDTYPFVKWMDVRTGEWETHEIGRIDSVRFVESRGIPAPYIIRVDPAEPGEDQSVIWKPEDYYNA
jgi:hypothetical protein